MVLQHTKFKGSLAPRLSRIDTCRGALGVVFNHTGLEQFLYTQGYEFTNHDPFLYLVVLLFTTIISVWDASGI